MPTVLPELTLGRVSAQQNMIVHEPRAGALPQLHPLQLVGSTTLPVFPLEDDQFPRERISAELHDIQLFEEEDTWLLGVTDDGAPPSVFNQLVDCLPSNHGQVGPGHYVLGHACQTRSPVAVPSGPANMGSSGVSTFARCSSDTLPETMSTCVHLTSSNSQSSSNSGITATPRETRLAPPVAVQPWQFPQEVPGAWRGLERAEVLVESSLQDDNAAAEHLTCQDNSRRCHMLLPLSMSGQSASSTDRQVPSSSDGRDVRRRLRTPRLRMNTAHAVQTAEGLAHVPQHEGRSDEDAIGSRTNWHSQTTEISAPSQPRSREVLHAIREFRLTQLRLRELAVNRQTSGIDTAELSVVENDGDDHDNPNSEEEHLPVQPATSESITPPTSRRPSNCFRRRAIKLSVQKYDASAMGPPDVQDSLNDQHQSDSSLWRRSGRIETATSVELPEGIDDDVDSI